MHEMMEYITGNNFLHSIGGTPIGERVYIRFKYIADDYNSYKGEVIQFYKKKRRKYTEAKWYAKVVDCKCKTQGTILCKFDIDNCWRIIDGPFALTTRYIPYSANRVFMEQILEG